MRQGRTHFLVAVAFLLALASSLWSTAFRFDSLETITADWIGEAAPALSAAGNARVYFDSGTSRWRLSMAGGAFADIVTIGSTDVLTNKTLTAPIMSSFVQMTGIAAPALSGAGTSRIYFDSGSNTLLHSDNGGAYGGFGVPAGSSPQFQYNNSGAFGGTSGFTWDSTILGWALAGGSLSTLGTNSYTAITGSFPAAPAGGVEIDATKITISSSGASVAPTELALAKWLLSAGYTGSGAVVGLDIRNSVASSAAGDTPGSNIQSPASSVAAIFNTNAGATVAMGGFAHVEQATTRNIAFWGNANSNTTLPNIGLLGTSVSAAGHPATGVYAGLYAPSAGENFINTPTALLATNGTSTADIIRGYDNSGLVFQVADVTGTAVNGISITGGATLVAPIIAAIGETNVGITLASKGTGAVNITAGSSGIVTTGAITATSTFTSSATADLGWSVVSAANQACNTTCTSACVVGFDITAGNVTSPLACTNATADICLCAGSS